MKIRISFKEWVAEGSKLMFPKKLSITAWHSSGSFFQRFSASCKALVENRAQHRPRAIILCWQWSWRIKNYFSLMRNDPEVQPPSALLQPFSLATFNFACQVSAQLQQSINLRNNTERLEKTSEFCSFVIVNVRPQDGTFLSSSTNPGKYKKDRR